MKKKYKKKPEKVKRMKEFYKKMTGHQSVKLTILKDVLKMIIVVMLFSSCSANYHLRKAIAKDPSILESKTITLIDTVYTQPIVKRDTFELVNWDTLRVDTGKVHYEIIRDTIRKKIYVNVDVPTDTIYVTREITLPPQVKYKKRSYPIVFFILLLALCIAINYYIRRRR